MKISYATSLIFATIITHIKATCDEEQGNWYCDSVEAISYSNFGTAGQYNDITYMQNGVCGSTPKSYSGGMAPMDGEVSWHFRGPMHLKQFAFYSPGSTSTNNKLKRTGQERRQSWQNMNFGERKGKQNGVDNWVTATINGQVVSWADKWSPAATSAPSNPKPTSWITATIDGKVTSWTEGAVSTTIPPPIDAANTAITTTIVTTTAPMSSSMTTLSTTTGVRSSSTTPASNTTAGSSSTSNSSSTASASSPSSTLNLGAGKWGRQAYYNAEQGVADGLVFLNHMGGQGSGVFDLTWGNSLSYSSDDAKSGSASPVILADTLLDDNTEIVVMTDKPCENGDCGTVRPGTVAYHGFDGASKLFLLEFDMPLTGTTGFNADMPAAWILNAAIPRTMQYGQADCSCWISGCGEFDIFEVLDSGNTKTKSTWHGAHSLGDSNWFPRPTTKTQKAAVIFDGTSSTGHIVLLPDDTSFDTALDDSVVTGFINSITSPTEHIFDVLPS